jgi:hypothetical protein
MNYNQPLFREGLFFYKIFRTFVELRYLKPQSPDFGYNTKRGNNSMRQIHFILFIFIFSVVGINIHAQEKDPSKPESKVLPMPAVKGEESNQPVVTLYVFPVIPQPLVPNMIVAFWPDGKVIWSEDPIEGGPPYSEGRVDPQALETLLEDYKTLFLVRGLYPRTFSHQGFNPC